MKIAASLDIVGDPQILSIALAPCLEQGAGQERSSIHAEPRQGHLHLQITSGSVASFRAVANSITQLLAVYEKMAKLPATEVKQKM